MSIELEERHDKKVNIEVSDNNTRKYFPAKMSRQESFHHAILSRKTTETYMSSIFGITVTISAADVLTK